MPEFAYWGPQRSVTNRFAPPCGLLRQSEDDHRHGARTPLTCSPVRQLTAPTLKRDEGQRGQWHHPVVEGVKTGEVKQTLLMSRFC
jgi:hypothetical protein